MCTTSCPQDVHHVTAQGLTYGPMGTVDMLKIHYNDNDAGLTTLPRKHGSLLVVVVISFQFIFFTYHAVQYFGAAKQ